MAVQPAGNPRLRAPRARWSLLAGGVLGVIVVLAAGVIGASHLTGPRWSGHAVAQPATTGGTGAGGASSSPGAALTNSRELPHFGSSWIAAAALVVLALAAVAMSWRLWRARRRRAARELTPAPGRRTTVIDTLDPEPDVDRESLVDEVDGVLDLLDAEREPADAVVRAWLSLEATAERSGITRRPSETPTEFTSRVLQRALGDDRAIITLLNLYLRTRFGEHPPSAADVSVVRSALADLVSAWRADPRALRRPEPRR